MKGLIIIVSKKNIVIFLLFICSCILILYYVNSSKTLGSIKEDINTKISSNSDITLKAKEGDKLKFKYASLVKEGILNFQLTDKEGRVIETFETGVSSNKIVKISKDDEYTLSATYDDFIGSYKIEVKR